MPLTCIRNVPCDNPVKGKNISFDIQIYNHIKKIPQDFHAVFSYPEKWFSLRLITPIGFEYIINDFPNSVDTSKDYVIDFLFDNKMWKYISPYVKITEKRWKTILYVQTINDIKMTNFVWLWISNQSLLLGIKLVKELMETWKMYHWNSFVNKTKLISIAKTYIIFDSTYAAVFKKELKRETNTFLNSRYFNNFNNFYLTCEVVDNSTGYCYKPSYFETLDSTGNLNDL